MFLLYYAVLDVSVNSMASSKEWGKWIYLLRKTCYGLEFM